MNVILYSCDPFKVHFDERDAIYLMEKVVFLISTLCSLEVSLKIAFLKRPVDLISIKISLSSLENAVRAGHEPPPSCCTLAQLEGSLASALNVIF